MRARLIGVDLAVAVTLICQISAGIVEYFAGLREYGRLQVCIDPVLLA